LKRGPQDNAMPVHCKLINKKWRIVNSEDHIEKTKKGNPIDGGGHETKDKCNKQARAINMSMDEAIKTFFKP
jgi:hypothetical protein